MKRHGESMRLVANLLDEEQPGCVRGKRDRLVAIARVQEFFLLGDADRYQIGQPEFLERRVRRAQLAFASVDDDEIRQIKPY